MHIEECNKEVHKYRALNIPGNCEVVQLLRLRAVAHVLSLTAQNKLDTIRKNKMMICQACAHLNIQEIDCDPSGNKKPNHMPLPTTLYSLS